MGGGRNRGGADRPVAGVTAEPAPDAGGESAAATERWPAGVILRGEGRPRCGLGVVLAEVPGVVPGVAGGGGQPGDTGKTGRRGGGGGSAAWAWEVASAAAADATAVAADRASAVEAAAADTGVVSQCEASSPPLPADAVTDCRVLALPARGGLPPPLPLPPALPLPLLTSPACRGASVGSDVGGVDARPRPRPGLAGEGAASAAASAPERSTALLLDPGAAMGVPAVRDSAPGAPVTAAGAWSPGPPWSGPRVAPRAEPAGAADPARRSLAAVCAAA